MNHPKSFESGSQMMQRYRWAGFPRKKEILSDQKYTLKPPKRQVTGRKHTIDLETARYGPGLRGFYLQTNISMERKIKNKALHRSATAMLEKMQNAHYRWEK